VNPKPKYPRYQDYVIKDGAFVGDFEGMYRDYDDPWEQSTRERYASEKAMALNALEALRPNTVLELGCGFGHFTGRIKALGVENVIGVDISETALAKASRLHPSCRFLRADILDFAIYEEHRPDVIVMAEITWYVLDKLDRFKEYLKRERASTYVLHLLTTYAPGEQRYGTAYFTDLAGILRYFGMNYAEYGEVRKPLHGNVSRTYFLGRYETVGKLGL
jgi:SAM-dependent methyltransferase